MTCQSSSGQFKNSPNGREKKTLSNTIAAVAPNINSVMAGDVSPVAVAMFILLTLIWTTHFKPKVGSILCRRNLYLDAKASLIYEMYGQADSHVVVIVENNNVGETNPRNNWSARN